MTVEHLFTQAIIIVGGVGILLAFVSRWLIKPIKNQTNQIEYNTEAIDEIQCKMKNYTAKLEKDFENINILKTNCLKTNKQVLELKVNNDKRITIVDEGMKLLLEDRLVSNNPEAKRKMQEKIQQFLFKNL
jgi:sucrose-6-phosphate hydrolase SacC (GH32 family)